MQRRTSTRALALAAAALLTLGLAACGDDDDDAADTGGDGGTTTTAEATTEDTGDATEDMGDEAAAATVVAEDFAFTVPDSVAPGATVTFDNKDSAPHTMTADDDAFDSGRIDGGAQGEVTAPSAAGSYAFHCQVHPNMTATLTVA